MPKLLLNELCNQYPNIHKSEPTTLFEINLCMFTYREISYTWPCVSGTLYKVTCPVYACTVAYIGQVTWLQGTRKARPCFSGRFVPNKSFDGEGAVLKHRPYFRIKVANGSYRYETVYINTGITDCGFNGILV